MLPLKRLLTCLLIVAFLNVAIPYPLRADTALWLPPVGAMVYLSAKFDPALMVGIQVDAKDPFRFNFLIERGQTELAQDAKSAEYRKLIKYFLSSLTIPNEDMWVNLSPYEHDRIIPNNFGQTTMGRDLLAQDYLLKQITASLIHPDKGAAKDFWDKVYARVFERYGNTDIQVDTFNKVWIVPDSATIYNKNDTAVIIDSHLKVMTEQDHLAWEKNQGRAQLGASIVQPSSGTAELAEEVIREIVVPMLEVEVNEGENFALLRQVYSAMLMATWFKKSLKESLLGQVYADKSKVAGVALEDLTEKEQIYQQYLKAYRTGVFDLIKEDRDLRTNEMIPRKYFSGGIKAWDPAQVKEVYSMTSLTAAQRESSLNIARSGIDMASVVLDPTDDHARKFELTDEQREALGGDIKFIKMPLTATNDIVYTSMGGMYSRFVQQVDGKDYYFSLKDGRISIEETSSRKPILDDAEAKGFIKRIRDRLLAGQLLFANDISDQAFNVLGMARMGFDWNNNTQDMPLQTDFIRSLEKGMVVQLDFSGPNVTRVVQVVSSWCDVLLGAKRGFFAIEDPMKEMIKNAIVHGNKFDRQLPVYISFDKSSGEFAVWDTADFRQTPIDIPREWAGEGVGVYNSELSSGEYYRDTIKGLTRVRFIPGRTEPSLGLAALSDLEKMVSIGRLEDGDPITVENKEGNRMRYMFKGVTKISLAVVTTLGEELELGFWQIKSIQIENDGMDGQRLEVRLPTYVSTLRSIYPRRPRLDGFFDRFYANPFVNRAGDDHAQKGMTDSSRFVELELQESQLKIAQSKHESEFTLKNIKPGQPDVTLKILSARASEFTIQVAVDGQKTGSFKLTIEKNETSEKMLIRTSEMFPIGYDNEEVFFENKGKNVTDTILNWLAWEAQKNDFYLRNDGTRNMHLFYLFSKYFGGSEARRLIDGHTEDDVRRAGKIDSEFTFTELVKKYGFYGYQIWGLVSDGRTRASLSLIKVNGGNDLYKVDYLFNYRAGQLQLGDIVKVTANGEVLRIDSSGDPQPVEFKLAFSTKHLTLQGPATPFEVPKVLAVSGEDHAQKVITDSPRFVEQELQESQLKIAQRKYESEFTLKNIKPGQPNVTLRILLSRASEFMIQVAVNGQKTGSFNLTIEKNYTSKKTLLRTSNMYPIGRDIEASYRDNKGKNVTNTILNWLAWEAKNNNYYLRNDGTRNMKLVYLFLKYFGGPEARRLIDGETRNSVRRPGTIDQEGTFTEVVKKYGYFGHQIWGVMSDDQTYAGLGLTKTAEGDDIYTVDSLSSYKSDQLKVGDIVKVTPTGEVQKFDEQGALKTVDIRLDSSSKHLTLQGPPSSFEVPKVLVVDAAESVGDVALRVAVEQPLAKGGIDLDAGLLNMKIRRDGAGVPLPLPRQDPVLLHIAGLSPTILEIAPANSLPIFSELTSGMIGQK